ncbi:MAG: class I SAM-dependent methyltransferase family protein [Candidatus Omnitrophica bacterium]|nr:class I SAM-dependent methyltransferase family protein [Candidatus Omnitrophota bacterium]
MITQKIIKSIMAISKLGRNVIGGKADSGLNIDHMYRNRPKGVTRVGKFVDGVLLNLPSVKATRRKKDIIMKILRNEIANNILLNKKSKILDIASGPARYIVDVLTTYNQDKIDVLCLDSDKRSINFGKALAGKRPIRYAKANVFKLAHLKALSRRISWIPNIIITTGFFEMLSDATFEDMLKDAYSHLEKNGLILFTAQSDNPSKKLMSKIGKKQDGQSWNMFFRTPEYLREMMINLNFRDVIISVDQWGMYEYCTGRKA